MIRGVEISKQAAKENKKKITFAFWRGKRSPRSPFFGVGAAPPASFSAAWEGQGEQ